MKVKNWDSVAALDFEKLNNDIYNYLSEGRNILLEGFCLRDDLIKVVPNIHIHLSYIPVPPNVNLVDTYTANKDVIMPRIIKSRAQAKPGIKNDEIVVNELVWPFYMKTLENSTIDYVINTFNNYGNRIDKNVIINSIIDLLEEL